MKKRARKIIKVFLILVGISIVFYLANLGLLKYIDIQNHIIKRDGEYLDRFIEQREYLMGIKPAFWSWSIRNNSCYAKTKENYNWVCILPVDSYTYMNYGRSMYPTIMIGNTMLLQKYPKYLKLKEGMIIRFKYENATYIHRIKEIKSDGKIIAKGDNAYETEEIYPENVTEIVVGVLYTSHDLVPGEFEGFNKSKKYK